MNKSIIAFLPLMLISCSEISTESHTPTCQHIVTWSKPSTDQFPTDKFKSPTLFISPGPDWRIQSAELLPDFSLSSYEVQLVSITLEVWSSDHDSDLIFFTEKGKEWKSWEPVSFPDILNYGPDGVPIDDEGTVNINQNKSLDGAIVGEYTIQIELFGPCIKW